MENVRTSNITNWNLNKPVSEVGFKFRYLLFTVTGSLKDFDISVETKGEDFTNADITFRANLSSINTNNKERDKGVAEYLSTHNLPETLSFKSTQVEKVSEHNFKVSGELTILNVNKPAVFQMQFDGIHRTPGDKISAGFTLHGKVEYLDFVPEDSGIRKVAFALNKTIDIDVIAKLDKAQIA